MPQFPPHPPPASGPPLLNGQESLDLNHFFTDIDVHSSMSEDLYREESNHYKSSKGSLGIVDLPPRLFGISSSITRPDVRVSPKLFQSFDNNYLNPSLADDYLQTTKHTNEAAKNIVEDPTSSSHSFVRYQSDLVNELHFFPKGLKEYPHDVSQGSRLIHGQSSKSYESVSAMVSGYTGESNLPLAGSALEIDSSDDFVHGNNASPIHPTPNSYQFGNDTSFLWNCFSAPPSLQAEQEVLATKMNLMDCLEPQDSADNTRAPSPSPRKQRKNPVSPSIDSQPSKSTRCGLIHVESLEKGRNNAKTISKRSRKCLNNNNKRDSQPQDRFLSQPKQKKTPACKKAPQLHRFSVDKTRPRVAKPELKNQKANRTNLSDEQKRSNHIISEQKRRDGITDGFSDLRLLFPTLHQQNKKPSKGDLLSHATKWLSDIIKGNDDLRARLERSRGKNGFS